MEELRKWLDGTILNQQDLLNEYVILPDWNMGYIAALRDVAKVVMEATWD